MAALCEDERIQRIHDILHDTAEDAWHYRQPQPPDFGPNDPPDAPPDEEQPPLNPEYSTPARIEPIQEPVCPSPTGKQTETPPQEIPTNIRVQPEEGCSITTFPPEPTSPERVGNTVRDQNSWSDGRNRDDNDVETSTNWLTGGNDQGSTENLSVSANDLLQQENMVLREQIEALTGKLSSYVERTKKLNVDQMDARSKLGDLQRYTERMEEDLLRAQRETAHTDYENEQLRSEIANLNIVTKRQDEELEQFHTRYQTLEERKRTYKDAVKELTKELETEQAHHEHLSTEHKQVLKELKECGNRSKEERGRIISLTSIKEQAAKRTVVDESTLVKELRAKLEATRKADKNNNSQASYWKSKAEKAGYVIKEATKRKVRSQATIDLATDLVSPASDTSDEGKTDIDDDLPTSKRMPKIPPPPLESIFARPTTKPVRKRESTTQSALTP